LVLDDAVLHAAGIDATRPVDVNVRAGSMDIRRARGATSTQANPSTQVGIE
jgi:hypothetical protein